MPTGPLECPASSTSGLPAALKLRPSLFSDLKLPSSGFLSLKVKIEVGLKGPQEGVSGQNHNENGKGVLFLAQNDKSAASSRYSSGRSAAGAAGPRYSSSQSADGAAGQRYTSCRSAGGATGPRYSSSPAQEQACQKVLRTQPCSQRASHSQEQSARALSKFRNSNPKKHIAKSFWSNKI